MRIGLSTFVALFLLSVSVSPVQAQFPVSYGIKAGFTSSSVSMNRLADEIERREGLMAVAFAEWFGASYFSLLTELGYVQRGYSNTVELRDSQGQSLGPKKGTFRFDYLTFSVLPKVKYSGSAFQPYILVGPRGDMLLRRASSRSIFDMLVSKYDMIAFGGVVGGGIEVDKKVFTVPIFVEVRYNTDVTDSLSCCPREIRNNAFDILIGVKL